MSTAATTIAMISNVCTSLTRASRRPVGASASGDGRICRAAAVAHQVSAAKAARSASADSPKHDGNVPSPIPPG
jgi:hypothetical protein